MSCNVDLVPMAVADRAQRLRPTFDAVGVEALLVTNIVNVGWLTGFGGSNGMLFVGSDNLVLLTDGRYGDQAGAQLRAAGVEAEIVVDSDLVDAVVSHCDRVGSVGLEADDISWAQHRRLAAATKAELVPLPATVQRLRAVKDAGEVARINAAAEIADRALAEVMTMLTEAPTEREVAHHLDQAMWAHGASGPAYETIVASGPNGALPHARPSDRVIDQGDLVIIDVGAMVDGYRSDMTRTFVIGEPTDHQQRQLDVVLAAQQAGMAEAAPGVPTRQIDEACRLPIGEAGWGEQFLHGAGHGVGLDIHELPRVNSRSDDVLEEGMVVTVEPGVYLRGEGGVRWEDLLLITAGGAQPLSASPKSAVLA